MDTGSVLGTFAEIIETYHGWVFVKAFFLLGIAIYVIFSVAMFRQTQLMDRVLKIPIAPSFKFWAFVYLMVAIAYFLLAMAVL